MTWRRCVPGRRTASRPPKSVDVEPPGGRRLTTAHGATPVTHLLSNGRYSVMLTAAGSGYSRWRDLAVTRWREDATCDDWGSYIFLRDVAVATSGRPASSRAAPSPTTTTLLSTRIAPSSRGATERSTTIMEVLVSAEDDAEVRRVSISNSRHPRARNRRHVLRRARAGAAGRRRRASGVFQAVRRNRISGRSRRHSGDPPTASPGRARNLGCTSRCRRWRAWWEKPRWKPIGPDSSVAAAVYERRSR